MEDYIWLFSFYCFFYLRGLGDIYLKWAKARSYECLTNVTLVASYENSYLLFSYNLKKVVSAKQSPYRDADHLDAEFRKRPQRGGENDFLCDGEVGEVVDQNPVPSTQDEGK